MTVGVDDINAIQIKQWEIVFDGIGLGLTVEGSVNIGIEGQYTTVDNATELEGIIAEIERGIVPTLNVEFMRADFEFIRAKLLQGRVESDTDGQKSNFHLGNKNRNLHSEYNGILDMQPKGVPLTDLESHVRFHKAAFKVEGTQLVSSRENPQTFVVVFSIYPDVEQLAGREYAVFGDFTLSSPTPIGVWAAFDKFARKPWKHIPAMSIEPDGTTRVNFFAGFSTDSGETVKVNDVAGLPLGSKTLNFDTLSQANLLVDGSVMKGGTEFMIVDGAPTYATSTSGVCTVIRETFGSVEVAHLDDADFNIYNNVAKVNVTDSADLTSSDPTKVTIGDIFQSTTLKNLKGIIAHVAAGTSNIYATFKAVQSPNMVITAL